jgi:hypothetical protein
MEWQQCSVLGCGRFCDLEYNAHPKPWCCLVCSLTHGARHSSKCICASHEPGHLFYDCSASDMSTDEAGDMSAGDSSDPSVGVPTVSTYVWSTSVDVETSNEVSDTPGNECSYTRRLRQDDSDWEAFQDSDTDSYSSVK